MNEVFQAIIPIILLIGIGAIAKNQGIFSKEDANGFTNLVFQITLPIAVFISLFTTNLSKETFYFPLSAIILSATLIGFSLILKQVLKLKAFDYGVILAGSAIKNIGFFAFPFISFLYDSDAVSKLFLYDAGNAIIAFGIVYPLTQYLGSSETSKPLNDFINIFKRPAIIAVILGLILNPIHHFIPNEFIQLLQSVVKINAPMVLISLGLLFSFEQFKSKEIVKLTLLSQIIIIPISLLVGFLIALAFNISGIDKTILLVAAASPAGMNAIVFAIKSKLNVELATTIVSTSMILSLLLIPFLIVFFN